MTWKGIMTALITPVNEDGTVNEKQLRKVIQFQLKNDVHSILVLGGTGEYLALKQEERERVIDIAVDEINGKIPVVAGLLAPGLNDNIAMGEYVKKAGVDAYMAITPYYLSVTQQGFIDFYTSLDQAIDMPVLLYNYPAKTNSNIKPETVEKLVKQVPNIIGIKECTYSTGQMTDLLRRVGDKITVYAGEEYSALANMLLGAKGAVMASSNIIPSFWVKLWNLIKEGKYEEAVKLNEKYYPAFETIFKEANPGPIKYALNEIGFDVGQALNPLVELQEETKAAVRDMIKTYNITK